MATYNDPALTRRIAGALTRGLRRRPRRRAWRRVMGGEDFGEFGRAAGVPSLMFWLGATPPGKFAAARATRRRSPDCTPHSSRPTASRR